MVFLWIHCWHLHLLPEPLLGLLPHGVSPLTSYFGGVKLPLLASLGMVLTIHLLSYILSLVLVWLARKTYLTDSRVTGLSSRTVSPWATCPILKQTSLLRKHWISFSFLFLGIWWADNSFYIWVGQVDTEYTQAVLCSFFSKAWNLLICLHSLGYINCQIMNTALFLTLHSPLILKSNLFNECPDRW